MRYDPHTRTVELTTRNINALNDKLDDPLSARAIGSGCGRITVRAVEDTDRTSTDTSGGVVTVTRAELAAMLEGETVTVGGIELVPVPDAAHYSSRPAGDVLMPSTGEARSGVLAMSLRHICEVCGRDEILTPAEAYAAGWDYPPKMGRFGIISPRTCPRCPMLGTVWAALADGLTEDMLTTEQREVVTRILAEPGSIMVQQQ
jgi:hypothetical protein